MAKKLFQIAITEDDLGDLLREMFAEDTGFDGDDFHEDLDKVCESASVDCGGMTNLTEWMWRHASYDYIKGELEDAIKEYMASVLNKGGWRDDNQGDCARPE